MRVLLLGATGNLGQRLIFSLLAHKHTLILYVRNPQKLADLVPSHILEKVTVVVGDATDSEGIYKALIENNCNAIVDTAGNQVLPWQEYLMPKIARAVMDAALRYKQEKGTPLRVWCLNALGNLKYPGKEYYLQDHYLMPHTVLAQHLATVAVIEPISLTDVKWSLMCVGNMRSPGTDWNLENGPKKHNLAIAADVSPGWIYHWYGKIPFIGWFLDLVVGLIQCTTSYENVADVIAEDLEKGTDEFVGHKLGYKEKVKVE